MSESHTLSKASSQNDEGLGSPSRMLRGSGDPVAPFAHGDACGLDSDGHEPRDDYLKEQRRETLRVGIAERRGNRRPDSERYTSSFVLEQAAQRFFMLARVAQASLKGRFTDDEFLLLLNAECHPIWDWRPHTPLANKVADAAGVTKLSNVAAGSPLRSLLVKLLALTPLENAVLVDACEQVWRGHDNPLL